VSLRLVIMFLRHSVNNPATSATTLPCDCAHYVFAMWPFFSCVEGIRKVWEKRAPVVESAQFFYFSCVDTSAQTLQNLLDGVLRSGSSLPACMHVVDFLDDLFGLTRAQRSCRIWKCNSCCKNQYEICEHF
jgi:hypothetical protein